MHAWRSKFEIGIAEDTINTLSGARHHLSAALHHPQDGYSAQEETVRRAA